MNRGISIGAGVLWALIWFGFSLVRTLLDAAVWRKIAPAYEKYLDVLSAALVAAAYLALLSKLNSFQIQLFQSVLPQGILLAAGCAVMLFLLNRALAPARRRLFPASVEREQKTADALRQAPGTRFFQICVIAPVAEEILMRDFLLGGLSVSYGFAIALLVSSLLFALLHADIAQACYAFACGIALGLLYLQTGSVFCCILAHAGYNFLAYVAALRNRP